MFVFNTNSWHFKIVKYVFGESFFTEKKINLDKTIHTQNITYDSVPKIVNLCPYGRALMIAIPLLPIAWIAKKIPKRKGKPFDIKKSRRNTKIIRIAAIIGISIFGVHQLVLGNYPMAIFHFTVASFQIWGKYLFDWYRKWYEKRMAKKIKNPFISNKKKNPSLVMTYLQTNHNKICPPIAFVDENDTEVRR